MRDLDALGIYVVNPDIWRALTSRCERTEMDVEARCNPVFPGAVHRASGNMTPSIAVREKVTMEVSDSSCQNDNYQLPLKTLVIEEPTDTDHTSLRRLVFSAIDLPRRNGMLFPLRGTRCNIHVEANWD
jgi:hypothetical protein